MSSIGRGSPSVPVDLRLRGEAEMVRAHADSSLADDRITLTKWKDCRSMAASDNTKQKLAPYQVDHLILLVGRNPLPNAVAGVMLTKPEGRAFL
jgi:hypothetical protein